MAKSSEYWKKRFLEIEKASNAYGQNTFRQIESTFEKAQMDIQKEIERWYGRYAKNNQITLQEAKKQLTAKELKELRWDVDEYIKYGRENALDQKWMKELENASARFHISRLEALKIRTQHAAEKAFGNELDQIDGMARHVFTEDYYHSIFEMHKGFGVGWDIGQIDERKLNTLITKPWAADGKNFSERIWGRRTELVHELHTQLTRTCILGKAPDDAIKAISKKFNTSKSNAGKLVMTEQAYFHSVAQKEAFKELDVEKYEIVATLDSHTSDICQNLDGEPFPMSQYEPGVTAPPFHVWCRSITVPYFDDEWGSNGERAARDNKGQTYYVPENMKYKDWKESFVKDSITDKTKQLYSSFKEVLKDVVPSIEEFVKIRYNDEEWKSFKVYSSAVKSGELTPLADFELYKNISKQVDDEIVGVTTSNGITISGKSNHCIARIIGSVEQRRNGVSVSDVLDALINKDSEVLPVKTLKNGRSQKFRNAKVEVSINPDTGNIIQVNPVHTGKKVKS
jgi:SPP1 gp7 family putative phage head morphogenesis protein